MFENWLLHVGQLIAIYPLWGLFISFLIAFIESFPILGTIVPGSVMMTFVGIAIGRHLLPWDWTIALSAFGALTADCIGFWLGKRFQVSLRGGHFLDSHPRWARLLKRGETFFQKHGKKSILIGRFAGPARSTVPLVAGLLDMPWMRFLCVAIVSGILWSIVYLVPGILIGSVSLSLPHEKAMHFLLIALCVVLILWLLIWLMQRFLVFLIGLCDRFVHRCWHIMRKNRIMRAWVHWMGQREHPMGHHQLLFLLLSFLFLILFLGLMWCIQAHCGLYHANMPVFNFLQSIRNARLDVFLLFFTELGDRQTVASISILFSVFFLFKKKWRMVGHFAALMIVTLIGLVFLKSSVFSPRPFPFILFDNSGSFPSAHSAFVVVTLCFINYVVFEHLKSSVRWISWLVVVVLIGFMMCSRIYLGAHWLCDVLGGASLGLFFLFLVLVSYRRKTRAGCFSYTHFLVCVCIVSICWLSIFAKRWALDTYFYTPYYPTSTVSFLSWWNQEHVYLPAYRLNRWGNPAQPFNVQWSGNIQDIRQCLKKNQWIEIEHLKNFEALVQRFSNRSPERHLDFFAQLYRGQAAVLHMIKHIPGRKTIVELQLWKTGVHFKEDASPLWIGSIHYRKAAPSYINLKPFLQMRFMQNGGASILIHDTRAVHASYRGLITQSCGNKTAYVWKSWVAPNVLNIPSNLSYLGWDRTVFMIQTRPALFIPSIG